MIERTFQNVPEEDIEKADDYGFLVDLGWFGGTTWQDLLCSKRVLIISEAGAGKTYTLASTMRITPPWQTTKTRLPASVCCHRSKPSIVRW